MSYPPPPPSGPPGTPPGPPPPGYGMPGPPPNHPQSTTILVLGICGLVVCGLLAPVAWIMGNKAIAEIDASGGAIDGRGTVNAGRICGMIGTALMALGVVLLIGLLAVGVASSSA